MRCFHDSYSRTVGDAGHLKVDDAKGIVEVPLKQFVSLLLRIDKLVAKVDELLDAMSEEPGVHNDYVGHEEFFAFAREWLAQGDRKCGLMRVNGRWAHVHRDGMMVGGWSDIEVAMQESACGNQCDEAVFTVD